MSSPIHTRRLTPPERGASKASPTAQGYLLLALSAGARSAARAPSVWCGNSVPPKVILQSLNNKQRFFSPPSGSLSIAMSTDHFLSPAQIQDRRIRPLVENLTDRSLLTFSAWEGCAQARL